MVCWCYCEGWRALRKTYFLHYLYRSGAVCASVIILSLTELLLFLIQVTAVRCLGWHLV